MHPADFTYPRSSTATISLVVRPLALRGLRTSVLASLTRQYAMSSRRSSRLSAATAAIKEDPVPITKPEAPKKVNSGRKRKSAPEPQPSTDVAPSTPKKKRTSKAKEPAAPHTPAAVGLMSAGYSSGDIDDSAPPAINRLAVPNGTNAPLLSPETRRVISNKPLAQVSPSKVPQVKTTTGNLLDEAVAHLIKVSPKLKPVIEQHPCHVFSPEGLAEEIDPFRSLVSGIISQQVCITKGADLSLCCSYTVPGLRSSSEVYQEEIRGALQRG